MLMFRGLLYTSKVIKMAQKNVMTERPGWMTPEMWKGYVNQAFELMLKDAGRGGAWDIESDVSYNRGKEQSQIDIMDDIAGHVFAGKIGYMGDLPDNMGGCDEWEARLKNSVYIPGRGFFPRKKATLANLGYVVANESYYPNGGPSQAPAKFEESFMPEVYKDNTEFVNPEGDSFYDNNNVFTRSHMPAIQGFTGYEDSVLPDANLGPEWFDADYNVDLGDVGVSISTLSGIAEATRGGESFSNLGKTWAQKQKESYLKKKRAAAKKAKEIARKATIVAKNITDKAIQTGKKAYYTVKDAVAWVGNQSKAVASGIKSGISKVRSALGKLSTALTGWANSKKNVILGLTKNSALGKKLIAQYKAIAGKKFKKSQLEAMKVTDKVPKPITTYQAKLAIYKEEAAKKKAEYDAKRKILVANKGKVSSGTSAKAKVNAALVAKNRALSLKRASEAEARNKIFAAKKLAERAAQKKFDLANPNKAILRKAKMLLARSTTVSNKSKYEAMVKKYQALVDNPPSKASGAKKAMDSLILQQKNYIFRINTFKKKLADADATTPAWQKTAYQKNLNKAIAGLVKVKAELAKIKAISGFGYLGAAGKKMNPKAIAAHKKYVAKIEASNKLKDGRNKKKYSQIIGNMKHVNSMGKSFNVVVKSLAPTLKRAENWHKNAKIFLSKIPNALKNIGKYVKSKAKKYMGLGNINGDTIVAAERRAMQDVLAETYGPRISSLGASDTFWGVTDVTLALVVGVVGSAVGGPVVAVVAGGLTWVLVKGIRALVDGKKKNDIIEDLNEGDDRQLVSYDDWEPLEMPMGPGEWCGDGPECYETDAPADTPDSPDDDYPAWEDDSPADTPPDDDTSSDDDSDWKDDEWEDYEPDDYSEDSEYDDSEYDYESDDGGGWEIVETYEDEGYPNTNSNSDTDEYSYEDYEGLGDLHPNRDFQPSSMGYEIDIDNADTLVPTYTGINPPRPDYRGDYTNVEIDNTNYQRGPTYANSAIQKIPTLRETRPLQYPGPMLQTEFHLEQMNGIGLGELAGEDEFDVTDLTSTFGDPFDVELQDEISPMFNIDVDNFQIPGAVQIGVLGATDTEITEKMKILEGNMKKAKANKDKKSYDKFVVAWKKYKAMLSTSTTPPSTTPPSTKPKSMSPDAWKAYLAYLETVKAKYGADAAMFEDHTDFHKQFSKDRTERLKEANVAGGAGASKWWQIFPTKGGGGMFGGMFGGLYQMGNMAFLLGTIGAGIWLLPKALKLFTGTVREVSSTVATTRMASRVGKK